MHQICWKSNSGRKFINFLTRFEQNRIIISKDMRKRKVYRRTDRQADYCRTATSLCGDLKYHDRTVLGTTAAEKRWRLHPMPTWITARSCELALIYTTKVPLCQSRILKTVFSGPAKVVRFDLSDHTGTIQNVMRVRIKGGNNTFTCVVSGYPTPQVHWAFHTVCIRFKYQQHSSK